MQVSHETLNFLAHELADLFSHEFIIALLAVDCGKKLVFRHDIISMCCFVT